MTDIPIPTSCRRNGGQNHRRTKCTGGYCKVLVFLSSTMLVSTIPLIGWLICVLLMFVYDFMPYLRQYRIMSGLLGTNRDNYRVSRVEDKSQFQIRSNLENPASLKQSQTNTCKDGVYHSFAAAQNRMEAFFAMHGRCCF